MKKKKKQIDSEEEKSNRHYPNQGIKVNITSSKNNDSMNSLMQSNEQDSSSPC